MNQFDIHFYWSIFLRRLPYFLSVVLIMSAIGITVALNLPPIFQADAKILIESPQISANLLRPMVAPEATKQLQLIALKLMTRADLVPVAEKFNLFSKDKELSADDIVEDMRSRTKVVPVQPDIASGSGATAFMVSFTAEDPLTAAGVVNEYVNLMLQRSVTLRASQASDTLQFFRGETERLSLQLAEIEDKILKLKEENRDTLPESLSFRRSQQIALRDRLVQIDREEVSLQDERMRLARAALGPSQELDPNMMTPNERMLNQLRQTLVEQRSTFSEGSPSIVALRSQIAALEKTMQDERAQNAAMPARPKRSPELDVRLGEVSQRLNLAAREKITINADLAKLQASIVATPAIETALNSLERERQNLQTQYGAAVAGLSDASAAQQIEIGSKGERLSLLEAAIAPQKPLGRKRRLIAIGSVGAGVMLALGLIVVLELLNKTIRRPQELFENLEITPLATIPYIAVGRNTSRERTRVMAALLLLATIPLATFITFSHERSPEQPFTGLLQTLWVRH
jgi:polysaccharide biosynthesis transport protein